MGIGSTGSVFLGEKRTIGLARTAKEYRKNFHIIIATGPEAERKLVKETPAMTGTAHEASMKALCWNASTEALASTISAISLRYWVFSRCSRQRYCILSHLSLILLHTLLRISLPRLGLSAPSLIVGTVLRRPSRIPSLRRGCHPERKRLAVAGRRSWAIRCLGRKRSAWLRKRILQGEREACGSRSYLFLGVDRMRHKNRLVFGVLTMDEFS